MKIQLFCFVFFVSLLTCAVSGSPKTSSDYDVLIHQGNMQLQAGNNGQALDTANSAIRTSADRWEAYALAGGALMNLRRYEEAAANFSEAIQRAPETKQQGLRDLRKQCLLAKSETVSGSKDLGQTITTQGEIVLWKSIENSSNPADYQTYLDQYPHGAFAALAQRHLEEVSAKADLERERVSINERRKRNDLVKTRSWTDRSTGLMWARVEYYDDLDSRKVLDPKDYNEAFSYCHNSSFLQFTDWRLPSSEELLHVFSEKQSHPNDILVPAKDIDRGWLWSTTPGDRAGEHILTEKLKIHSKPDSWRVGGAWSGGAGYALCVRRSTD